MQSRFHDKGKKRKVFDAFINDLSNGGIKRLKSWHDPVKLGKISTITKRRIVIPPVAR